MATSPIEKVTNNSEYNTTNKKGYCQFPDGTLICYGEVSTSGNDTTAVGFAKSFSANPKVFFQVDAWSPVKFFSAAGVTVGSVSLRATNSSGANLESGITVYYVAIGRWK